ncbi:MAG: MFS transporter [Hyphomonadaceae bacterium]|nr:MFS transporter [Hyphomonadaceae bacterium]
MLQWRLIACVLLPFAGGYYLSYLFRAINAVIAGDLKSELDLGAADLGFLTSIYFLVFAAVQLPFGMLLDRYGPRLMQSLFLLIAGLGALVFALSDGLIGLVIARILISVGVATALMAGLKAIVLWFPPDRLALANGWLIMLGALGGLTATAPAEVVVQSLGWRGLFAVLGALSALFALLILVAVPERAGVAAVSKPDRVVHLSSIICDPRFWRLAPLSATGVATAWSLQGLWAAPWLADVAGLERSAVVQHLSLMAIAVCVAALLLGFAAGWWRRAGKDIHLLLAGVLGLSMLAQLALLLGWPLSTHVTWAVIAAAGAGTVLSFAILPEYFPKEASGRANSALSLLHVGGAFLLQYATGLIIEQWPQTAGKYPVEAYQVALGTALAMQVAALVWFLAAPLVRRAQHALSASASIRRHVGKPTAYALALAAWRREAAQARQHAASWRMAAAASLILCTGLAGALSMTLSRSAAARHFVEVDQTKRNLLRPRIEVALLPSDQQGGAYLATADVQLPLPPDEMVSSPSRDLKAAGPTGLENPSAIATVEHRQPEGATTAKVSAHVDQENATEIERVSVLEQPEVAFRRHGSARPHQQRRVRRPVPERTHGAALRPANGAHSRTRALRHRQAHARVPGRDALAGRRRDRHAHRARGTLVAHARTSSVHRGASSSNCGVDSCSDRRKKPQIDAAGARNGGSAALDKPRIRPGTCTRHITGFPPWLSCQKLTRASEDSRRARQSSGSCDPLLSLVTEVSGWLSDSLPDLAVKHAASREPEGRRHPR